MKQRTVKEVAAAVTDDESSKWVAAAATHETLQKEAPATEYVAGA